MSSPDALNSKLSLDWPLMRNNITREDIYEVIRFLESLPILTQSKHVRAFEEEWSQWLGMKYSVFVNSGSSANLLTISILKELYGLGDIIVPPLTWVSDIASVIQCGFKPVFVDIKPRTLGMNEDQVISKLTSRTKAVFLTHILGYNALTGKLLDELKKRNIPLIEDTCESHGATFQGKKVGSFGLMSNFSFYYAHHVSTIEGGMVCTNDERIYQMARMFRAHGLVREASSDEMKKSYSANHADLNPEFIFAFPAYNMRSTEINAVLGRCHLKRLDEEIVKRNRNLRLFLERLDPKKFRTDFQLEGSSNYAFTLVIKEPDPKFSEKVMHAMREHGVEFRRGTSGGGNQLRQPYLKRVVGEREHANYPEIEHIHFYGFYIGNYPDLSSDKIERLCDILNNVR